MKKQVLASIMVVVFLGFTAFVVLRGRKQPLVLSTILERKGAAAQLAEWPQVRSSAQQLQLVLRDRPDDTKSALALAALYIQEARITGEVNYYNEASLRLIDEVLAREPKQFDALLLKAVVQLSQHHFAEALQTAEQAKAVESYNAFLQGIFVDAYVELGNYDRAVAHSDQMMSIRPDIRSYSRVGYLRELHGDLPGAIEAMTMAVQAGGVGDEATEWARVQLARLYELTGQRDHAAMHYTIALDERPGYAPAIAGQARLAADSGQFERAIALADRARQLSAEIEYRELLAELREAAGQAPKAAEEWTKLEKELSEARAAGEGSANHHAGKELAWIHLRLGNHGKALELAKAEYRLRPDNIDANELMAWCHYKSGNARAALPFLQAATRTKFANPSFLCRAGLIHAAAGDPNKARELISAAWKNNPVIEPELKKETKAFLQP